MKKDNKALAKFKKAYNSIGRASSKKWLLDEVPINAFSKNKISDFLYPCRCAWCQNRNREKLLSKSIFKDNLDELNQ